MITIVPTLFDYLLTDIKLPNQTVSPQLAEQLFTYFKNHSLFNWQSSNNGCEGRADAVCTLLDHWNIPNYKAWIFGGNYLKNHIGELKQNWKYHVATVLAVEKNNQIIYYVLDPSTSNELQNVNDWASNITLMPHSYYCLRQSHWYIFPIRRISKLEWNSRNKQNRKWMIQCLLSINSLSTIGKAQLSFQKAKIKKATYAFEQAKKHKPQFIL